MRRILLIGLICQASSGFVNAYEGLREIKIAVKALNVGNIEQARESITGLEQKDSLEVRYLTTRLQAATSGQAAPDLIQMVPVPTGVEV